MKLIIHDFNERLNFSEGVGLTEDLYNHIINAIPKAYEIEKANLIDDKSGVDYWVLRDGLRPIAIDAKNREFCPIDKFGTDDACVETTSVYAGPLNEPWQDEYRNKIGWTLNKNKQTDYILYTWPHGVGLRFWILPFHFLCTASRRNWRRWSYVYGEKPAKNDGYITLSIYPPRQVIAHAMRELMYNETPPPQP